MESTYGDRSHGPRVDYLTALADCIQRTLDQSLGQLLEDAACADQVFRFLVAGQELVKQLVGDGAF